LFVARRLVAWSLASKAAKSVSACVTHGVLSDHAEVRFMKSHALSRMIITDSIEARPEVADCPKIEQVPIATLLAEAIRRIANEESVSSLFD